ncbi:MAG: tRNA (N(6)-L-threonylcarbamoyladenosine(37)-C(2))-methylthiotran sferase MtaB [Nitrospinaceae bacterium]|nr:MAG: tRNA (N(6)-L-threonylcarbamoyladenosine(37)-C(2))-methylthiotran sferase MtaB [Nitrospinaceae bacterium]
MKVAFATLGCRTNQHDTAEMQTLMEQEGFSIVDSRELADVYVINTCSVTQRSDYSSRLAVKKSLAINDQALVVFTGCYAQLAPDEAAEIQGLDIVLGNANKLDIARVIKEKLNPETPWNKEDKAEIFMSDIHKKRVFRTIPVSKFQGKTKAFIKVQTGCDEKCAFCTVVRARGKSISDERENILNNVKEAIDSGFKEITLTGINLGTYGMEKENPETFSSLVREIVRLPGDFRIRLSSINPMEIDDDLIQLIADEEKICPHLHIPLQSGDDDILAKMRRNYTSGQYLDTVHRALEKIPRLGLGADIIIGFPGETDERFENTRKLIESLPFTYLHAFAYSPRKGTEAYGFKSNLPKTVKKERNKILTDMAHEKSIRFRRQLKGETVTVLFENQRDSATGNLKGHTEHYIPVSVPGGDRLMNQLVPVKIEDVSEQQVLGCLPS